MLLLTEGSLRKGVGEKAAIAGVVCVVRAQDGVNAIVGWGHPYWILGEIGLTLMMTIDVLPGTSIDEGEFVRS